MVDRAQRIGDNWRSRYHQLVLHDPVWFDHLPYLPFPENWPVFTPKVRFGPALECLNGPGRFIPSFSNSNSLKDKLGDWFESYVKLLELNAWTNTSITESSWDAGAGHWKVTLDRLYDGKQETRVFYPKVRSLILLKHL